MIGVVSSAYSPASGGGLAAILGWAAVLSELAPVNLYLPFSATVDQLQPMTSGSLGKVRIETLKDAGSGVLARARRLVDRPRRHSLVLHQTSYVPGPKLWGSSVLFVEFPLQQTLTRRERFYLGTHDVIVGNSEFTRGWIERRWSRPATAIPPAVAMVPPRRKRPWIVSVGRFLDRRRTKHQLEMVECFKGLSPRHPDWRLVLGGFALEPAYAERVREAARGWPIDVQTDLSRPELEVLLGRSSIYWHAAGAAAGDDEPELCEHFGISTVEAMSAGCVPVVIAKGGQVEILGEELAPCAWRDWEECAAVTERLMAQPSRMASVAEQARRAASRYDFESFRERALAMAAPLLAASDRESRASSGPGSAEASG